MVSPEDMMRSLPHHGSDKYPSRAVRVTIDSTTSSIGEKEGVKIAATGLHVSARGEEGEIGQREGQADVTR